MAFPGNRPQDFCQALFLAAGSWRSGIDCARELDFSMLLVRCKVHLRWTIKKCRLYIHGPSYIFSLHTAQVLSAYFSGVLGAAKTFYLKLNLK